MRLIVLFLFWLPFAVIGQEVHSYLSAPEIFPGQTDTLLVTVLSNDKSIVLPVFSDTITEQIEIFGQDEWDTVMSGDGLMYSKQVFISSFDTGYIVVPPVKLEAADSVVASFPLLMYVQGEKVDLNQNIKGVNDIESFPITWQEVLKYSLFGLGVVLLLFVVYQLFKRLYFNNKNNSGLKSVVVPERPFMEVFWERYEAVKLLISTDRNWSGSAEKNICSELSELLRSYLEYRYQIPAMENTSARILQQTNAVIGNAELEEKVRLVLVFTDQVKFAKGSAMKQDCERLLVHIKSFVDNTVLVEASSEKQKGDNE